MEAEGEDLRGPVKVEGDGGEIRLRDVHAPVEVKGHRLTLRITLEEIVPVTADIENDLIEVTLPDTGGFTLDAQAENGQIRVPDHSVEVEPGDHEMRARGPVRDGGPILKLHSSHGDIVIR